MVIDFLNNGYSTSYSSFDVTYSDIEDEMSAYILSKISDTKLGLPDTNIKSIIAMCIYDTLVSLSGNPEYDYIPYVDIKRCIYNFNMLTNSSIDVNFR